MKWTINLFILINFKILGFGTLNRKNNGSDVGW